MRWIIVSVSLIVIEMWRFALSLFSFSFRLSRKRTSNDRRQSNFVLKQRLFTYYLMLKTAYVDTLYGYVRAVWGTGFGMVVKAYMTTEDRDVGNVRVTRRVV